MAPPVRPPARALPWAQLRPRGGLPSVWRGVLPHAKNQTRTQIVSTCLADRKIEKSIFQAQAKKKKKGLELFG